MIPGSYQNGFAPRDDVPQYPSLWSGCDFAAAPCLGPTGSLLRDWSRQKHGTVTATLDSFWAASAGRWSLLFNGASFSDHGNAANQTTNDFSISLWMKTTVSEPRYVVSKYSTSDTDGFLIYGISNKLAFYLKDASGGFFERRTSANINDGLWHHVVGIRSGATVAAIYVDGIVAATTTIGSGTVTTVSTAHSLRLGSSSNGAQFYSGSLDDVRIYNRAIKPSEILLLYSGGRGIAYTMREYPQYTNAFGDPPTIPGVEFAVSRSALDFMAPSSKLDYAASNNKLDFSTEED